MTFVKGKSGNPGGRVQDKPWTEALRLVVYRTDPAGKRRLLKIAEACAAAAEAGDMTAVREIGDRLDGKPAQETNLTVEKRDATDWSFSELVAFLREEATNEGRVSAPSGSATEPDIVH